jgi:predicted enzyme related to lactoylglutathione lyase
VRDVNVVRHVVVLDAVDVATVSDFWARLLGGRAITDDDAFHCVIDADGNWIIGVQRAPDHVAPGWPNGTSQQVHLDFHVDDPAAAHAEAIELGAQLLQGTDGFDAEEGHRVYADPAGHPFCIGWGHPDADQLRRFLAGHDLGGS